MSLRSLLRVSDSRSVDLQRLRQKFPGFEVIDIQADTRYLQLELTDEHCRKVTAFFSIDLWLNNMNSHLPDIPWQQVPLEYLARWLNTLQLSFLAEDLIWTVESVSYPEKFIPTRLLEITAEPCSILCLDWPDNFEKESAIGFDFSQLPFKLRYVLGTSQVELCALVELLPGDLLVIKKISNHLAIGQYNFFNFSYQGNNEVIVEKSIFNNQFSEREEDGILLDWTKVPVDVEFVLDHNTFTLDKLNDINIGSTLPVSADAEQRVRIYLNRKLFAQGELVALEGGGLAVEINHININQENIMSGPDAK